MQIKLKKWNKNTPIHDGRTNLGGTFLLSLFGILLTIVVVCNKLIKLFSLNQRDAIYLHLNLNKTITEWNENKVHHSYDSVMHFVVKKKRENWIVFRFILLHKSTIYISIRRTFCSTFNKAENMWIFFLDTVRL